ncbi:hypothetical protein QBC33DRAFT_449260, partial [Phialemonium atrogriseum]
LDGLSLALSSAGAYLDNTSTTFAEYLQMYNESWLRLQESTPDLLSYEDRALHSTWNISYAQVKRQNTASAMLLQLWAYFDNEDLWFELLREYHSYGLEWFRELTSDALNFIQAVRVLCEYGLVEADTSLRERGTESRGYGMHACVHLWTVHVLNVSRDIAMERLAVACVALHSPEQTDRGCWAMQRRLMQHASRCVATLMMSRMPTWIQYNLGNLYGSQGRLSEAALMDERALRDDEKILGPGHILTLYTVNNLGILYETQGRLSEAEAMRRRALRGKEKAVGPDHVSTLDTDYNLGSLYNA